MEAHDRAAEEPERPGWWATIWIVLGATLVAWGGVAALVIPLSALHLVPFNPSGGDLPGTGWPWRIDGPWALAADLGPTLLAGFLFAMAAGHLLQLRTGVAPRRWPLALLAAGVGWIPVVGDRPGLIGASGGLAFAVMVVATRSVALRPRPAPALSRAVLAALAAAAVLVAAATSFSYGALHPLTARNSDAVNDTLREGRGDLLFTIANEGPRPARILGVRPADSPGLRVTRLRTDSERDVAPTLAGLYKPLGQPTLGPGEDDLAVYMTVSSRCPSGGAMTWRIEALRVRLRVAGSERTQRVALASPPRVQCPG